MNMDEKRIIKIECGDADRVWRWKWEMEPGGGN